jgi:3-oxoacid CoA-transferase subunit B
MPWSPAEIAARLAADIREGWTINLGTGLPTAVADHIEGRLVFVHSENGIIGIDGMAPAGEEDPDVVDAGKNFVTVLPGAAFFDSATSFGLMRSGRLDLSVMGSFQVSSGGDLANWRQAGKRVAGVGGAADLAVGARQVWVIMTHRSKEGEPKLVDEVSFPLTAPGVVKRVYTDLGVFEPAGTSVRVLELAPGVTLADVRAASEVSDLVLADAARSTDGPGGGAR